MRILFDQGTPVPLRDALIGHTVETAYERGWSRLTNGELLAVAEASSFDVLITTDQTLRKQQNLSERRIAIIVLPTTRWRHIQQHADDVLAAVATIRAGEYWIGDAALRSLRRSRWSSVDKRRDQLTLGDAEIDRRKRCREHRRVVNNL